MANLAELPVIRKRKLFEDVAAHLRRLILSQKLKDGDRLPSERELAERFGVGRPSVREALRTLSQLGLVEIRAGAGAFVRKPGFPPFLKSMGDSLGLLIRQEKTSLLELCDARRILEVETAAMAAERAGAEDIACLQASLAANEAALDTPARFRVTDVAFHRAIAQATHNRILLFIHDALSDLMLRTREMALKVPGAAPDAFASHQKILLAIKNRDRIRVAREMAIHLEQVRGRLQRVLKKGH
jgi:GntR family transcriptional repressor for pyruvate dehydrogenase complex